jgi:hypothetical protein
MAFAEHIRNDYHKRDNSRLTLDHYRSLHFAVGMTLPSLRYRLLFCDDTSRIALEFVQEDKLQFVQEDKLRRVSTYKSGRHATSLTSLVKRFDIKLPQRCPYTWEGDTLILTVERKEKAA